MKLRNKETGEIIIKNLAIKGHNEFAKTYNSLAELNAEWEDYEEPKGYWYYDTTCGRVEKLNHNEDKEIDSSIGNCFETKKEAEKAVEKLKALKRLKDKGFKFDGWGLFEYGGCDSFDYSPQIGFSISNLDKDEPYEYPEEIEKDLDLLFSGGEE